MMKIKRKIPVLKIAVVCAVALALLGWAIFIIRWLLLPSFQLVGDSTIKVPYGETFSDPGYHAELRNEDLSARVSSSNNIDLEHVGSYTIEYVLEYNSFQIVIQRTVLVVDEVQPEITLAGKNPGFACTGQLYEEAGFTAKDNYDGDLTDKVIKEEKSDSVSYTVEDSSGNQTTVIRPIQPYVDNKPAISLTGGAVQLVIGTAYDEPGYKATDICEGNITQKVKTENNVNKDKLGDYIVKYTVKNSQGNLTEVERLVRVNPRPVDGKGMIYLTFDDGPSALTAEVLDILKSEGVKATFFVVGKSSSLDHLIKRAHNEGHTIGIHSFTHNYKQIYASETAFFNDLYAIQNRVQAITGQKPYYTRFPGGSSNTVSSFNPGIMSRLTVEVKKRGFVYFDWNITSGDAGDTRSSSVVYSNVIKYLSRNHSNVVLMHDSADKTYTVQSLRNIIRFGKRNGYAFSAIDGSTKPVVHRVNN